MTVKYIICGLVQGIGFRPSVKRAADFCNVSGTVKNLGGAVEVIAQGNRADISAFKSKISGINGALITNFSEELIKAEEFSEFQIIASGNDYDTPPLLTPDIATCDNCLEEFSDPQNRRYMHPFISCTRCGPRYSITRAVPYDRENITMSEFDMCGKCAEEYVSISDSRCHAQTIACNDCGPRLSYTLDGDPLSEAVKTLKNGGVTAIKDIGGYHLACGAFNAVAAARLREIKQREAKPFAVMFHNVEAVREYAYVSEQEAELLLSPARPIVLLRKKKELAKNVCDRSGSIGAFLPCNPVQHYLTQHCGALVMTSANLSGEPIIAEDTDILRLREQTGGFEILSHNRAIENPSDDSVCRVICGKIQIMRRARGFVPLPVNISAKTGETVLAAGSDLKASFCYCADGRAYMSRYFGDLETAQVCNEWKNEIDKLGNLLKIKNPLRVCDLHPGYFSADYVGGMKIQHHFAHMASVMAEHNIDGSALGFIFDGTGCGEDNNVWGGEVIRYDGKFTREASLEYTELLGGDSSAKSSTMTLDCYLLAAGIPPQSENASVVTAAVKNHVNTVKSSSMGRLFDAVSAMLGISNYNSYEGECAIMLENAAKNAKTVYPLSLPFDGGKWRSSALIRAIAAALKSGTDTNALALGFHIAVADAVCAYAASNADADTSIILSGGVFSNELLTTACFERLSNAGYSVYINEQVPPNDGGIALGQAWYALKTKG